MSRLNEETIRLYMEAAQQALEGAEFNLDAGYYSIVANRAYYAFFYAASAILLTRDLTRSKHSGVLAAFREYFIKPGLLETEHSDAFGKAFIVRQTVDYDVTATADESQARELLGKARGFVARVARHLAEVGYS